MSAITHELVVRDQGLHSQRVVVRSSCRAPTMDYAQLGSCLHVETGLPSNFDEHLLRLMELHARKLEVEIGQAWLGTLT